MNHLNFFKQLLQCQHHFSFLLTVHKGSSLSTSHKQLLFSLLLDSDHPTGYEAGLSFDLDFPNDESVKLHIFSYAYWSFVDLL